jgi:phosphatidate cytidylyltransferase
MDRNLAQRIGFAAVAIPLALAIVWYGGWPLAVLVALIAGLGARELFGLFRQTGGRAIEALGVLGSVAVPIAAFLALTGNSRLATGCAYAAALWLLAVLAATLATHAPSARPLEAVSVTVFAVCYAAALPAFLMDIRHAAHPERSWAGTWLVFFPLVVTWVCDTAAMFGGRTFGGAKLAPVVSPGKTRAGAVAGLLGALIVAVPFGLWVFPAVGVAAPLGALLLIAAALSVAGQVGDLAESLFKREAGVKDSSDLIPGHGGVLDRFDSLYFVVPAAAVLYRLLGVR